MKVKLDRRLIIHKQTDQGKSGEEFIGESGQIYDLSKDEAYHLIKLGLATEVRLGERIVPKARK